MDSQNSQIGHTDESTDAKISVKCPNCHNVVSYERFYNVVTKEIAMINKRTYPNPPCKNCMTILSAYGDFNLRMYSGLGLVEVVKA